MSAPLSISERGPLQADAAWLYLLAVTWCTAARSQGLVPIETLESTIVDAIPLARGCGTCAACHAIRALTSRHIGRDTAQRRTFRAARAKRSELCAVAGQAVDLVRGSVQ